MNKLTKILIGIIVILILALSIITYEYINLRNSSKDSLNSILEQSEELQNAYIKIEQLENKLKSINDIVAE